MSNTAQPIKGLRVEAVEVWTLTLNRLTPFSSANETIQRETHAIIALHAGGMTGWGEAPVPLAPLYLPESLSTVLEALKNHLIPRLLGMVLTGPDDAAIAMAPIRGNLFAKHAVETAALDLICRYTNISMASLLGATHPTVAAGATFGLPQRPEDLFDQIDEALSLGHTRIKVKIAPGRDHSLLRGLRQRYPDIALTADGNSAYSLDDAADLIALDDFNLTLLEQPLAWDDFVDHAILQAQMKTPLALDESLQSENDLTTAIALGSCRAIVLKPAHVGGPWQAKKMHDRAKRAGLPIMIGGMHDFCIARAANLSVAALPGCTVPGDVGGTDRYYATDLIDPPLRMTTDGMPVPICPDMRSDFQKIAQFQFKSTL
ncbi:MAG: o-succinylbenzoate synthase [Alphaproteobacteria bacterium]|nr:o-succinylbenzoate synthase [Alphaproteobacteria bacterium]